MPLFISKLSLPLCIYLFVCLLTSTALTSCANTINYDDYLSSYAGINEEQLITFWGAPSRIFSSPIKYAAQASTQTNLVFQTSERVNVMLAPAIYQPYFDGQNVRHRLVQPERWQLFTRTCETTFIIQNKHVIDWYYFGDGCHSPVQPQHPKVIKNPTALQ